MKQTWFQRSLYNPMFSSLKANLCWEKIVAFFFIEVREFYVYFEIAIQYFPI
jgi:hypothetical protein